MLAVALASLAVAFASASLAVAFVVDTTNLIRLIRRLSVLAGSHTAHWTGDNHASFDDLSYSIPGACVIAMHSVSDFSCSVFLGKYLCIPVCLV
jgi:hypothetical protein